MLLSLSHFKRPPQDNGRGIHLSAAPGWNGGDQGIDDWIAELEALGIKWAKILDDQGNSLPLCRKLIAAGIFPVVRILRRDPPPNDTPQPNPGHLNAAEELTIRKLLDAGVLYFETDTEPDLPAQWKHGAIPSDREEAAKLVALNWLFDARFILDAGGYPALPAVSVGSDLDLMGALVQLGRQSILLEGCWLALHNYAQNRPLEYPTESVNEAGVQLLYEEYDYGALSVWTWWSAERVRADTLDDVNRLRTMNKNGGATIMRDHACFREFEYYDALAQKYLGRSIPVLGTEGGYIVGRREDPRYPRITPKAQADLTVALFDFMQHTAPEYFFAQMPWLMLPAPGFEQDAWYGDFWPRAFREGPRVGTPVPPFPVKGFKVGTPLPVVAAVRAMPNVPRHLPLPAPARGGRVAVSSGAGKESVYVVQAGDTLASIAKKFGRTTTDLVRANNISDPSLFFVGQSLKIPPAPAAPPPPPRAPIRRPPAAVSASVAPRPPTAPLAPKPGGIAQFDPRLKVLGVDVLPAMVTPGYAYWKLVRAVYEDPNQAGGAHDLWYAVLDEGAAPVPQQRVLQSWSESQCDALTDASGQAAIEMSVSYAPDRGDVGPYTAWVDGLPSDRVVGLGLPLNRPVNFRLTWQKTIK